MRLIAPIYGALAGALLLASSAGAEMFGSPLRAPNYPSDCRAVDTPGLPAITFAAATSCIWADVPAPTELSTTANVTLAPSITGTGAVTDARIEVGNSTGPMEFVVMRSLYENTLTPGRPDDACCFPVATSQPFTPAANSVSTVALDLPMREDPTPAPDDITTIADFDTLTLAVLAPDVQVPLYSTGDTYLGSPAPADFYWDTSTPSTITPGFTTDSGGWAVDINADFTAAGGSNGTGTGGGGAIPTPTPTSTPTTPRVMPAPTPSSSVPVLELAPHHLAPVKAGAAELGLTCTMAAQCAGRPLLRNAPLSARTASIARKRKQKARVLTYGSASFMLPSGTSKTLAVPLSKAGKALLAGSHGRAVVWADVQLTGGGAASSTQVTLRR